MLTMSLDDIEQRARRLAERMRLPGWRVTLASGASAIGGGSAPGVDLPTVLIALTHDSLGLERIVERLRAGEPPVIARIEDDRVVLDLRTVLEEQDDVLATRLAEVR
jgi:L-seryl-tRNA(Ser) seleniumtransferase